MKEEKKKKKKTSGTKKVKEKKKGKRAQFAEKYGYGTATSGNEGGNTSDGSSPYGQLRRT